LKHHWAGTQNDVISCIDEWIMENVEGDNENVCLSYAPNSNEDDEHLVKVEAKVVGKRILAITPLEEDVFIDVLCEGNGANEDLEFWF